jgi:hypothetical protein
MYSDAYFFSDPEGDDMVILNMAAGDSRAPGPVRIHLKTGAIISDPDNSIEKYNGIGIDGGAATILDMVLRLVKH